MQLKKYRPFSPLSAMDADVGHLFPRRLSHFLRDMDDENFSIADWSPAVDIRETDSEYVVSADIPGVEPDKIDVSMEDGAMTISGKRESERKDEDNGYLHVERFEGSFFRRFMLPDKVDPENVTAKNEKGVLTVRIPKVAGKLARKIKVSS